jgi:hypothetical protein
MGSAAQTDIQIWLGLRPCGESSEGAWRRRSPLPVVERAGASEAVEPDHARTSSRPRSLKPVLSGPDFILPPAVTRAENGDLSLAVDFSVYKPSTLEQVFALAELEDAPARDLSSLTFAELQLEKRRYLDWLKREPKNKPSRCDELRSWLRGGPQANENLCLWFEEKEEKRRTALRRKANRLANCGTCGRPMDCSQDANHTFYGEYACEMRYCTRCGEKIFADLFSKYMGLWSVVRPLLVTPGVVIAKLDFTAVNLGRMPTSLEVRQFNEDIRECVAQTTRALGYDSKQFGFLYCDEFGGFDAKKRDYNTNLHAHGVYVGPFISWQLIEDRWVAIRKKRDGATGVWIQRQKIDNSPADFLEAEKRRFTRALGHALKYTGKHVTRSDGKRLAQLEEVFHGVRRVHTMGLFYHADLHCLEKCSLCESRCDCSSGHEGQHSCKYHRAGAGCPVCGAALMYPRNSGYRKVSELKREGRRNLDEVKREIGRERVFAGPRGAPLGGDA